MYKNWQLITLLWSILMIATDWTQAQLCINEVSIRNWNQLPDHEYNYPSWIEIYNSGNQEVWLEDYALSDDSTKLHQWQLPSIYLAPKEYLVVYASGKDLNNSYQWETVVKAEEEWRYFSPSREIVSTWKDNDFDDKTWYVGKGGFGYGDDDDATIVQPKYALYLRKSFDIVDKEAIRALTLHMDFDDAFVAFLNGKEIARYNIGISGDFEAFDDRPKADGEAQLYQAGRPTEIDIPDERWKSFIKKGKNTLAIQAFNLEVSSDMSVIPYLSVGLAPKDTGNYQETPYWWNRPTNVFHTNFKLKPKETVYLTNKNKKVVSQATLQKTLPDYSQGRYPDGSDQWVLLEKSTPSQTNLSDDIVTCINDAPKLNVKSGFYQQTQKVKLTQKPPKKVKVRYELGGKIPTEKSPVLKRRGIKLAQTEIVTIRAFNKKCGPSKWKSYAYFVNEIKPTLPVVSIVTPPKNLWSDEQGIYVDGLDGEKEFPYYNSNYWKDWEVPVHMQYFDKGDTLDFEQTVGLEINGGGSRTNAMKSLRLSAKSDYGKSKMKYPFFKDKDLTTYRRILLKNAGQNFNRTHLTDAFFHRLVRDLGTLEIQSAQPCVVYFNGEYMGVHQMREKFGRHYLQDNFDIPEDSMVILGGSGHVAIHNDDKTFFKFLKFVGTNDMTKDANYKRVSNTFDLRNFCDYFIANIFGDNEDWKRINNVKIWRSPLKHKDHWRFFFVDLDLTFGERSNYKNDRLGYVLKDNFYYYRAFQKLVENPNFRRFFLLRYFDLLNTTFTPQNMKEVLAEFKNEMEPEMERHFEKWSEEGSYEEWKDYYLGKRLNKFMERRPDYCFQHLQEHFDLGEKQRVKVDMVPKGSGTLKFNTMILDTTLVGYYPEGMTVSVIPEAKPGYRFNNWEINGEPISNNKGKIRQKITGKTRIRAVFFKDDKASQ